MFVFIAALVLLCIALLALDLRKTYGALPVKELKRRARQQDPLATGLYRAASYGASLAVLLWTIIVLSAAGSFVLLSHVAPTMLAFLAVAIALAYGFVWMPTGHATNFGIRLAIMAAPALVWLLAKLHPILDTLVAFARKHRPITVHTGLFERDDLLALIERQKGQPDSRISPETLDLLTHTLTFGDKLVRDCMVPRRAVHMISADDAVGPTLMQELHDSGHSRFPVYKDKEEDIVGTLYLRKLVTLKHTGHVRDVMDKNVYFVHEEHPLEQVLDAFLKTQHHLFVVVNSFEEFVGIITIEDILEQILGAKIVDEFDQYDDVRAVAAHQAKQEHDAHKKQGSEVVPEPHPEAPEGPTEDKKTTADPTEVVK